MKKCSRCNSDKEESEFKKDKRYSGGFTKTCRACRNSQARDYYHRQSPEAKTAQYVRVTKRFADTRRNASKRGLLFSLTSKQFDALTSKACRYCGKFSFPFNHTGIDRVDPCIGYLPDNCVPCCSHCNVMKMDYTLEEFIEQCRIILQVHDSQRNQ